jgi:hypothetical protein
MTKTRLRKLTVERVITYRGNSTPGTHVDKYDRAMLLRRLASLTDAHDNLIANGLHGSVEAQRIRIECVRCLKRLGVSQYQIRKLTSAKGPLPEYVELDDGEPADAANNEGDHDETV